MIPARLLAALTLLAAAAQAQQGSPAGLSLAGTATVAQAASGNTFTVVGNASITGFGANGLTGAFYATGSIGNPNTLSASSTFSGGFTILFPSSDVLAGQLAIPAGFVLPALIGQSSGATGSMTVTGGTGSFAGASGSFPTVSGMGTGTATGQTTSNLLASGNGTLRLPFFHVAGMLAYGGSMAHLASGGGWKTTITLVNSGSSPAQVRVSFFDENGGFLTLPLTFPQGGAASSSSSFSQTLGGGAELVFQSQGPDSDLRVGSAQLFTDGNVSAFVVFQYAPTGQEASVPLQAQNAGSYILSFDNSAGFVTGVAVANASLQGAFVPAILRDETGIILANDTIQLAGQGHTSFVVTDRYPAAAQHRGTLELQGSSAGQISALAIRAAPSGAFTTIPAIPK